MAKRSRLALRTVAAVAAIIVLVVAWAPVVSAEVVPGGPAAGTQANPPTSTVELAGTGSGQGVSGVMSTLTPEQRLAGYPGTVDPSWPRHDVGFAGLIKMRVTAGPGTGSEFFSYCIDILTPTGIGSDYKRGEWTEAGIPNVGYVAQLLQSYFPTTGQPSSLTNVNARAAAVQSAIWYFSDGYVLASNSPLFATVRSIVTDVIARGPLTAPPAPTLTVTGPSNGLKNTIVGPFVVDTNGEVAAGRVPTGVEAFGDAAGNDPLGAAFPVADGDEIWLRSAQAGIKNPALTITATATQPGGVVFVYVPPQSTPNARAQTIIQAGPLTAETDVNTRVAFLDIGSFTITKSITGDGAGQQGPIVISIVCSAPNSSVPAFNIPGGTPGGTVTTVVTGITVPARCILTETASGDTQEVDVFADAPAAASRAAGSPAAVGARRSAQFATQEISVCPSHRAASRRASRWGAPVLAWCELREPHRDDHDDRRQHDDIEQHDHRRRQHHDDWREHDVDQLRLVDGLVDVHYWCHHYGCHYHCRHHHRRDHDRRDHHGRDDDRCNHDGRNHHGGANDGRSHHGGGRVRVRRRHDQHDRRHDRPRDAAGNGVIGIGTSGRRTDRSPRGHRPRGARVAPRLHRLAGQAEPTRRNIHIGSPTGPRGSHPRNSKVRTTNRRIHVHLCTRGAHRAPPRHGDGRSGGLQPSRRSPQLDAARAARRRLLPIDGRSHRRQRRPRREVRRRRLSRRVRRRRRRRSSAMRPRAH